MTDAINVFVVLQGTEYEAMEIQQVYSSLASARKWVMCRLTYGRPVEGKTWEEIRPNEWKRGFERYVIEEHPVMN